MNLKLDENLGAGVKRVFAEAGHDVETAVSERLSGARDETIFAVCRGEGRCLVTLDLDFVDPVRFRSRDCAGIVVLRLPRRSSARLLNVLAGEAVVALGRLPLEGGLWIVEPGRIRVHQQADG